VRLLYLTDRISLHGGADQHLLQIIGARVGAGDRVTVAAGRFEELLLPDGVERVRIKGLASAVASTARLGRLGELLDQARLIHVQNVMNPVPLRQAVETGRAVVTVQDHRIFCPGLGKTLPTGTRCDRAMSDDACAECLPDGDYRRRTLGLTAERLGAIRGARRVIVLSRYMAGELEAAGIPAAAVIPPWVEVARDEPIEGEGFLLGGRLVAHKGMLDGWRAWRRAETRQPLRVAGAGPLEPRLVGSERLGWLPGFELRRWLARSRALLFPGFWQEPFGILGVEALAEGTPVVVAETGGTADWSDQGCLRVPPGDIEALASAIRRLARDPELALALGRAGRRMVSVRFARATLEPQLRQVYDEAVRC
jgi:glycosyltransferase involved in cell wall biosynthesis